MARYRISRAAQLDLVAILTTSREQWGEPARARYAALLAVAMQTVAADPEVIASKDRSDLSPGLRSFHLRFVRGKRGVRAPVHVLYYRAMRSGVIQILGVLHERMDPERHVAGRRKHE